MGGIVGCGGRRFGSTVCGNAKVCTIQGGLGENRVLNQETRLEHYMRLLPGFLYLTIPKNAEGDNGVNSM